MLLTFMGLVIFSAVFVFNVSNTKYHILCSEVIHVTLLQNLNQVVSNLLITYSIEILNNIMILLLRLAGRLPMPRPTFQCC